MQTITTLSTRERLIRNSLVAIMLLGYAGWSFYDGYVGYPQKNLEYARGELPSEVQSSAAINPAINSQTRFKIERRDSIADVEQKIGPPAWKGPSRENINRAIWFGPGGSLVVHYSASGSMGGEPKWRPGKHTEKDLVIQKGMGIVVGALGLYALIRVLAMLLTRVQLSDDGLKTPGGTLIRFDDMCGWDPSDYKEKGRIRLAYRQCDREKTFVLDDYKIAAFRPIVDEICARKGFENPLTDGDAEPVADG